MNLVYTKFSAEQAGHYLTGDPALDKQVDGHNDLTEAKILGHVSSHAVTPEGIDLFETTSGEEFLERLSNENQDVIMFKGRKMFEGPLILEVGDGIDETLRFELRLSIAPVEQMFRHINLINYGSDEYLPPIEGWKGGEPDRINKDSFSIKNKDHFEGFDKTLIDENFVFVHGYNVNGQQARGWQAEIFKRLYWSGSNARFWGVSWYGSDSQVGPVTPDFHINVRHAFRTAVTFRDKLNKIIIGPKNIAAHSLGNMVLSSALLDYGDVSNIDNVFLIDAAVALEAYTGALVNGGMPESSSFDSVYDTLNSPDAIYSAGNPMVYPEWYGYAKKLGIAEWHQHFKGDALIGGGDDKRKELTIRDRFSDLTGANFYNFYSSGEEVLDVHTGGLKLIEDGSALVSDGGRHSWALQEKLKGRMWFNVGGSRYGGWALNLEDYYDEPSYLVLLGKKLLPSIFANKVTIADLKIKPFFKLGEASHLVGPNGSSWAKTNQIKMIAEAIPATTIAAGGEGGFNIYKAEIGIDKESVRDMQAFFANGWPKERIDAEQEGWRHSDLKNVAYLYIYEIFEKMAKP